MNLLWTIALSICFTIPSVHCQREDSPTRDLSSILGVLGLDAFAEFLAVENPDLLVEIGRRKDTTIWAPSNLAVQAHLGNTRKRGSRRAADSAAQCSKTGPGPQRTVSRPLPQSKLRRRSGGQNEESRMSKRQNEENSLSPDSNYESIRTFLDDPEFINLGPGQVMRFAKNQGAPLDGSLDGVSPVEIVTGLGNVVSTARGPFKFDNGVIYEVNSFFTLPESFSATLESIGTAKNFLRRVKKIHGKLRFIEETPATTIFVPIDAGHKTKVPSHWRDKNEDIRSHMIHSPGEYSLFLQDDLWPNTTISTVAGSGAVIKVSSSSTGEVLVNCRRIVKANVMTKNSVIHFIDGPLFGGCPEDKHHQY